MEKCRKMYQVVGICGIVFIIWICLLLCQRRSIPEQVFQIYWSFKIESEKNIDTSIHVIVNIEDYDMDVMFQNIKEFHNKMNGEPDKLEINLYNSRDDLKQGNCVESRTYYKN